MIAEVVHQVQPPQGQAEPRGRLGVVGIVMHHVVGDVAGDEAGQRRVAQRRAE